MKRVGYQIEYDPETEGHLRATRVVKIRAVGVKDRNRVLIGGEEVEVR